MIKPRYLPPTAYFDNPTMTLDQSGQLEREAALIPALASSVLTSCGEWITRGRGGVKNRALRTDIVLLSITPQFLPTRRPSAAWVASQHGVSRQRASDLWREFSAYIGPYIQFRGQRFLNRRNAGFARGRRRDPIATKLICPEPQKDAMSEWNFVVAR